MDLSLYYLICLINWKCSAIQLLTSSFVIAFQELSSSHFILPNSQSHARRKRLYKLHKKCSSCFKRLHPKNQCTRWINWTINSNIKYEKITDSIMDSIRNRNFIKQLFLQLAKSWTYEFWSWFKITISWQICIWEKCNTKHFNSSINWNNLQIMFF